MIQDQIVGSLPADNNEQRVIIERSLILLSINSEVAEEDISSRGDRDRTSVNQVIGTDSSYLIDGDCCLDHQDGRQQEKNLQTDAHALIIIKILSSLIQKGFFFTLQNWEKRLESGIPVEQNFIFKFQSRIRQMSTDKVSQELFLSVKERLDYHHLPTTFPIEATLLLNKLIKLLDGNHRQPQVQTLPPQFAEGLSAALRHEMGHVIKENNKLHMDLMTAREEIQSLQHRLYKFEASKHCEAKEMEKLSTLKGHREQELVEELREIKFKYNELMDFIHEDPKFEREYIKRLMKHRNEKVEINEEGGNNAREGNSPARDKTHSSLRIKQLEAKLKNREAEILRLQNIVEYDGMDMNKIIKHFQDSLTNNKLKVADNKINYLEQSLDKVKRENQNMKNNNGSKEALRAEVEKCHQIIDSLKKENKELKRNHNQQNFDVKKQISEQDRKVAKIKAQKQQAQKQAKSREEYSQQQQKKISFLEKEAQELRAALQNANKGITAQQQANHQNSKKNEELRVFYEYQIQTYKKKLQELQFQLHELRLSSKKALHENDILRREGDVKSEAIVNLEKIVNELLKKNSLLADNTLGTLENFKRTEDIQTKRQLIDLQQQLIYAQNEREQMESDRKAIQQRFSLALKDNERFKSDLNFLRNEIVGKQTALIQVANELQDIKLILKKTQYELSRATSQLNEITFQKTSTEESLKQENEKLAAREKSLRAQLKELDIKLSEQQGILDITKIKLAERQERIKHIERLLSETVEQSKALSAKVGELEQQAHQLSREKHRITKKYEQTKKQAEDFKNGSFKTYEAAINDDLNERARLKQEIHRLMESQERLQIRYEEVSGLLSLVRREKELQEVDKIDLQRQSQHLQIRLAEMQEIQRALVIENQSLRNLARRL